MKSINLLFLGLFFYTATAQVNSGSIIKTIPDSITLGNSFELVLEVGYPLTHVGQCIILNNVIDTNIIDTIRTKSFYEYPYLQVHGPCLRYDTLPLVFNTIGTKYIMSEWLMRDTISNIPYTTIGRDTLVL